MSHDDGVAPGEEYDDSPWRPDAAVTFDHPPRRPFQHRDQDPSPPPRPATTPPRPPPPERMSIVDRADPAEARTERHRPSRAVPVGLGIIVVLAIGVSVVVGSDPAVSPSGRVAAEVDTVGSVSTVSGGSVGCAPQQLPAELQPLWDLALAGGWRVEHSAVTVSDDTVLAIVGSDAAVDDGAGLAVVAIDLDDGWERWRVDLRSSVGEHEIVGVVDRTVIMKSAAGPETGFRRLFGFDEDSGELLWDRGFRGDWTARVDDTTGLVYVGVQRPVATSESEVEVIAARDGNRVHVAAGSIVGVDPDGRLITRRGDKVLATSPSSRDLLGVVEPSESPFVLLGSELFVANGNGAELSRHTGSGDARTVPLTATAGFDPPDFVVGLEPLGTDAFAVVGGGAVHGVDVEDASAPIRWSVPGVVVETAPSDRGHSLLVATEGGAIQRVIDGATGREIVDVPLRPGSFTTLEMVSNGVVVLDVVDGMRSRTAVDLDGRELWSLAGTGPIAVGRNVVVTVEEVDAALRVSAFGDPSSPAAGTAPCARG